MDDSTGREPWTTVRGGSRGRQYGEGAVDRIAQGRWPSCPRGGARRFLGVLLLYISNATQLACLLTENSFPMGNKHISI